MIFNFIYLALVVVALTPFRIFRQVRVFYFACAILFVLTAFRYEVGCDYYNYLRKYQYFTDSFSASLSGTRDPGYWLITRISKNFGMPFQWFQAIATTFFFAGIIVLGRHLRHPMVFLTACFAILIVNMPMSAIRQGIAIGFFCMALYTFADRKPLRFGLLLAVGSLFHTSIIIFFPMIIFAALGVNRRSISVAIIAALPILFILSSTEAAEVAQSRYIESDLESNGAIFRIGILVITAIYHLLFFRKNWKRIYPRDYSIAIVGYLGMLILPVLMIFSSVIADRFAYYFFPIQAIMIARIPELVPPRWRNLHLIGWLAVLGVTLFLWTSASSHFRQCYLPFQTSFS